MNRLLIIALLFISAAAYGQDDVEYRWEIGAGAGMTSYQGDFNRNVTKDLSPNVTLLLKRVLNPHMAIRLAGQLGKLKGSSEDVETYYPQYQTETYNFNRSLVDVSAAYEYNFFAYGTGHEYRGARRFTPFIFGGLGFTSVSGDDNNAFTMNIPLGIGVKYRASARLNLALEWSTHFSLSDKLDGVEDPYGIKSSGLWKNTDGYTVLQFTATYSFSPKCRTCHNANSLY